MFPDIGHLSRQELGQHRSELQGLLHAWERILLDAVDRCIVIPFDIAFMYRLGCPSAIIRRVWRNIHPEDEENHLVRLCLDMLQRPRSRLIPSATAMPFQIDHVRDSSPPPPASAGKLCLRSSLARRGPHGFNEDRRSPPRTH